VFESVVQTGVFFIFYWSLAIMAFDDDKEELIEYLDTIFFYLFTFILFNFFFKHSIHYFSFLEASASGSRSTMFLTSQFKGDFLALFSMILRFYSLLLRLNVYDILDDCLDFYYVFIGLPIVLSLCCYCIAVVLLLYCHCIAIVLLLYC
jgi:hypothetical protein